MNAIKTRLIAATAAVFTTAALFAGVVSLAELPAPELVAQQPAAGAAAKA